MKLIYALLFVTISNTVTAQMNNEICWNGISCLAIDDFKLNRYSSSADSIALLLGGKKPSALSSIVIKHHKVSYDTINKYRLKGVFEKNLSWLNINKSLLLHEQTHFNINQLMLRETNKVLDSVFHNSGTKLNYDSLINRTYKQLDSLQNKFDKETNSGADIHSNKEWADMIGKLVVKLDEYGIECVD